MLLPFRPRTRRRFRHALVFAAALPLFQFSACSTAIGQTVLLTGAQIPNFLVNSVASALLDTLFSAIGLNNLFGNNFNNNNNNFGGGNNNFGGGNNNFGGGNNNVGGGNTGLGGGNTGIGGGNTGTGGVGI